MRDLSLHANISRAIASPYFSRRKRRRRNGLDQAKCPTQDVARNARKVEEKGAKSNNNPKEDVARNAKKKGRRERG